MPHIIVKLWPGKSEEQKQQFANKIVEEAIRILNSSENSLSVAFEEIEPQDWGAKVYQPEISNSETKLYKKPGYEM